MLHIAQAQLEDAGPYMCQLNTDPMKSRMGVLNVIIKPDIVDVTGPRAVAEGGNVRYVFSGATATLGTSSVCPYVCLSVCLSLIKLSK